MSQKETLLFISTRFLFPVDSGGKIRTTQILRGLKGGRFHVRLLSPATRQLVDQHADELSSVCDDFVWWQQPERGRLFRAARGRHLFCDLPIPVRTDWSQAAALKVQRALEDGPEVAVFDFLHSAVLAPEVIPCPTVMFTHNVESEIFSRHRDVSQSPLLRAIWASQTRKMDAFESSALRRFDVTVAVSERDAQAFANSYGVQEVVVIPTGVDLEYFSFHEPRRDRDIVFCGSMDWLANQEAVGFFLDEVWGRVCARVPDAKMTVIGRAPPQALVQRAKRRSVNWTFTGFVDDVRPYLRGATVSVIPIRVGGGTRLKVYEAMAAGTPVVSTRVGVEGLPVQPGEHYLQADGPDEFADAVVSMLVDGGRRRLIAKEARKYVEERFSYRVAAKVFENACDLAMTRRLGEVATSNCRAVMRRSW